MKHTFEITIEATSQEEATEKLKAASTLMRKLKHKELEKLADIVLNDPVKAAMARQALGL